MFSLVDEISRPSGSLGDRKKYAALAKATRVSCRLQGVETLTNFRKEFSLLNSKKDKEVSNNVGCDPLKLPVHIFKHFCEFLRFQVYAMYSKFCLFVFFF